MKVTIPKSFGIHFQAKALSTLLYPEQQQGEAVAMV
jgi:hypothetical protein